MKLAASNIAWASERNDAAASVLRAHGFAGVELAPTKWRSDPFDAPAADVAALRAEWKDRGLEIVSLQSLLFGRPELQLFGSDASRAALADYLRKALDFAAAVGARAVVFGSPKNRTRGELSVPRAVDIARELLHALGDHAAERGVAFCVEANPPEYGCDFITTTAEAIALCAPLAHPAVRVNGDLGGITMNDDSVDDAIRASGALLGHFHASDPNLAELGACADHDAAARALRAIAYSRWVSIEMRAAAGGDDIAALERAVRLVERTYGSAAEGSRNDRAANL